MVKVLCGHFCIACLRPLTRRYILKEVSWKILIGIVRIAIEVQLSRIQITLARFIT
ncbi:hypothetical protein OC503_20705 [Vibrio vulnificus]|nr:hypothetical protein [Vibrio vulnificus]MCU8369685.1 hypothetical protein [Vibrio vulnificus]